MVYHHPLWYKTLFKFSYGVACLQVAPVDNAALSCEPVLISSLNSYQFYARGQEWELIPSSLNYILQNNEVVQVWILLKLYWSGVCMACWVLYPSRSGAVSGICLVSCAMLPMFPRRMIPLGKAKPACLCDPNREMALRWEYIVQLQHHCSSWLLGWVHAFALSTTTRVLP